MRVGRLEFNVVLVMSCVLKVLFLYNGAAALESRPLSVYRRKLKEASQCQRHYDCLSSEDCNGLHYKFVLVGLSPRIWTQLSRTIRTLAGVCT